MRVLCYVTSGRENQKSRRVVQSGLEHAFGAEKGEDAEGGHSDGCGHRHEQDQDGGIAIATRKVTTPKSRIPW
jgi:hypothetical protein